MSEKIKYAINAAVVGGVSIQVSGEVSPDAYEKIQVTIPGKATDKRVNLQPDGTNLSEFLLIKSSTYDAKVTYKINDATATAITLDGPHIFIGKGAVGILNSAPTKLFFSNALDNDISVDILLGRDATP